MMSVEVVPRSFGVVGHTYQPIREVFLPNGELLQVVPDENEKIYQQCYKPIFVDQEKLPSGFHFSLYGTLREWMMDAHPNEYAQMVDKIIQMPGHEYQVLGDPYLHVILPLLPEEDQNMLLKMGRMAFISDLGFEPKGLWLPETATAKNTFWLARRIGYEFGVLRDNQLISSDQNPMYLQFDDGSEMAIIHFVGGLSGSVSFNEYSTMNADIFLEEWVHDDRKSIAIATDTELYGHHRKPAVEWLRYLLQPETLARHGFIPLSIRQMLASGERTYTDVVDNSSWSCDHNLERWKGGCGCGGATEETQAFKRYLSSQLTESNGVINQSLDALDPNWRDEFVDTFLSLRREIVLGKDFLTELKRIVSREKFTFFAAKIYTLLGFTSCGWFDGKEDSPEREIPKTMVSVVDKLLGGIQVLKPAA